ncbi:hypothetical protein [Spirochaeta thermophila]|uniref:Uncharacterized protein n=1 Tax=Winmispira thermophila (strain ATCC 49972 / DSM 6192 / RI 19.B1) TaxID=665571 RepID=E0RRT4_WINT6|nr:hypothetical protein [Spirochaeta thermophila]ADN01721.1 hypothetical protein STHERM_c07700 [Spirochaeta thermophila DSM 6192]
MELVINQKKVDIALEHEQTLGEVFSGVEEWLNKAGLFITEARLNGEAAIPLEERNEWERLPLDQVKMLEITAYTPQEFRAYTLSTLREYLLVMKSLVEKEDYANLRLLAEDFFSLREHLSYLLPEIFPAEGPSPLEKALKTSSLLTNTSLSSESKEEILGLVSALLVLIEDRIEELLSPLDHLRKTAQALSSELERLSEVSILLQTGKAVEARDIVLRFSEYLQRIIRLLGNLDRDTREQWEGLPALAQEINGFLTEVTQAYEDQDYVLVGDLFEYEIIPRMRRFLTFLLDR